MNHLLTSIRKCFFMLQVSLKYLNRVSWQLGSINLATTSILVDIMSISTYQHDVYNFFPPFFQAVRRRETEWSKFDTPRKA